MYHHKLSVLQITVLKKARKSDYPGVNGFIVKIHVETGGAERRIKIVAESGIPIIYIF